MDITVSAKGTRQDATAEVRDYVNKVRAKHPESAALLSALGDEVRRRIAVSDEPVDLVATITITQAEPAPDTRGVSRIGVASERRTVAGVTTNAAPPLVNASVPLDKIA